VDISREEARRARPRGGLFGQLLLVVGAWLAYSLARSLSGDDVLAAVTRGQKLLDWDDDLGFGWVLDANRWVTAHGIFAVPLSYEYAALHYVVTPLVLVWLWRWHPISYRPALMTLMAMSAVGLVVYVSLPVAPPRLLPGFDWMDTLQAWSGYGWWGGGASAPAGLEHLTDQYAAMPSLHVGWAVWCAWAWRREGGTIARRFGWLYPTSVAATVVLTGNHYVLDVAAGVVLALVACAAVPRLLLALSRPRANSSSSSDSKQVDQQVDQVIILEPELSSSGRRLPVPAAAASAEQSELSQQRELKSTS
jgi:hypothetical protein